VGLFPGVDKLSRMRRGVDTGGSTPWPVDLSDLHETRATFPSKMQQQNPPRCEIGSPDRLKPAPQRQTTGGVSDGCSKVHPDNFLHFQLMQDSLGSTRSQAGRHQ